MIYPSERRRWSRKPVFRVTCLVGLFSILYPSVLDLDSSYASSSDHVLPSEQTTTEAQEKARGLAERALSEAAQLKLEGTPEGLKRAIQKYEEALTNLRMVNDRLQEAIALADIGAIHAELGQKKEALSFYNKAFPIFRSLGDRGWDAFISKSLDEMYKALGGREKTLQFALSALPFLEPQDAASLRGMILIGIGIIYRELGNLEKAEDSFNQSLAVRRQLADQYGEGIAFQNIGQVYEARGDEPKALDYYDQALSIFKTVGARPEQSQAWPLISQSYFVGDRQKTLAMLLQALVFLKASGARGLQAGVLNGIAVIYRDLGDYQKSLEYAGASLEIFKAVGDRRGETDNLLGIGQVYERLGEPDKALDNYNRALAIEQALGVREEVALTLTSIGKVYSNSGEAQKAGEYFNRALTIFREIGAREGRADVLARIGWIYSQLGDTQRALQNYNNAMPLFRVLGNRQGEADALYGIATIYLKNGESQKAFDHFNQALPLFQALTDRLLESETLVCLGRTSSKLSERQKALEYYNQALQLKRLTGDTDGEASVLYYIAADERDGGNLTEARVHIESVLGILESLRTKMMDPEIRTSYFASSQKYHEFYIDLLMRLNQQKPREGFDALALGANDRARARSLLELLTESRTDIRQGIDPELISRERSLLQLINAKAQRQMQLLGGEHTDKQADAAKKEMTTLLGQYEDIQSQIRKTSPHYASLLQPQHLSAADMQAQLLDADTVLLSYSLGEERSYLWAVTQTEIKTYTLPKRGEIEAAARLFYDQLTAPGRESASADGTGRQASTQARDAMLFQTATRLSDMVLGPVASQLGRKRLLIMADGALHYVPFAALPGPQAPDEPRRARNVDAPFRPLVVDHEVVNLPSASTVALLRKELADRKPAPKLVAILADPVFDKDDERVKKSVPEKSRVSQKVEERSLLTKAKKAALQTGAMRRQLVIPRLPATRSEAEKIYALVPEGKRMRSLDFAANRQTATGDELGQYRYVHFATHGFLDNDQPELSGILLSLVDEQGNPQDGFLLAHELYNLKLQADMVVLSACQTGLGKEVRGEGLIGLTRGLMYAGAARVVVSLWSVDDEATAELMAEFYRGILQKGLPPAQALRAAQVTMWKQKQWRAPYYWAAFVLQGEWK